MKATLLLIATNAGGLTTGYIIGATVALAILGYLVYSLVKPEKF